MTPPAKPTANMQKTYHLYPVETPGYYFQASTEILASLAHWQTKAFQEKALLLIHPSRQEALAAVAGEEPAVSTPLGALRVLLKAYVDLVDSGDAGSWDSSIDSAVIAARAAIPKLEAAQAMQKRLVDALAKAVSRQGFTNEELLAARELLKEVK